MPPLPGIPTTLCVPIHSDAGRQAWRLPPTNGHVRFYASGTADGGHTMKDPSDWSAAEVAQWVRSALEGAGVEAPDAVLGALCMNGTGLLMLSQQDWADLLPEHAQQRVLLRSQLQRLQRLSLAQSQASYQFTRSVSSHARLLHDTETDPQLNPEAVLNSAVEVDHIEQVLISFEQLQQQAASGSKDNTSHLLTYLQRGSEVLSDLPHSHPLSLSEGSYLWTQQRSATIQRMFSAVLQRHGGYMGAGGMCAALCDVPGTGKTMTVKMLMTLSAFLLPNVIPFYHDYAQSIVLPHELLVYSCCYRRGQLPSVARRLLLDHRHLHDHSKFQTSVLGHMSIDEDRIVPLGFLDNAHTLWKKNEPFPSKAVHTVHQVYDVGATPTSALIFLSGDSKCLPRLLRGDNHDSYGAYPRSMGPKNFPILRLGTISTMESLRKFVNGLRHRYDEDKTCRAPSEAILKRIQFVTGGVPSEVVLKFLALQHGDADEVLPTTQPSSSPPSLSASISPGHLVQLPPPDSLEMALLQALRQKYGSETVEERIDNVFQQHFLEEREAMSVNSAFHRQGHDRGSPAMIVEVLQSMAESYQLTMEEVPSMAPVPPGAPNAPSEAVAADEAERARLPVRHWKLLFPQLLDRIKDVPLSPLTSSAPALFLDPFWRQGPENMLRRAFEQRSVVFVLGAGVSIACCTGAPTWQQLIVRGASRLPAPDQQYVNDALQLENDPVKAATLLQSLLSPREFGTFLLEQFSNMEVSHPRLLKAIGKWNLPIITCNYDGSADILQKEHPERSIHVWTDDELPVIPMLSGRPVTFHIHGRFDKPESVVFGDASYDRVLANDQVQSLLRQLHSRKRTLVYVGFGGGLEDPNFGRLLRWADDELRDADFRQYVLLRQEDAELWAAQGDRERYQRAHTIPVVYGTGFDELPYFIEHLTRQSSSPTRLAGH